MSGNDVCPWCKYQDGVCGRAGCDFRTLSFNKADIIKRIQDEMAYVQEHKSSIERDASIMREVMDKLTGVGIMTRVLRDEFKVSNKEIRKFMGVEMGFIDRTKLLAKLAMMKKTRGR